jgi:hypothetical protein
MPVQVFHVIMVVVAHQPELLFYVLVNNHILVLNVWEEIMV